MQRKRASRATSGIGRKLNRILRGVMRRVGRQPSLSSWELTKDSARGQSKETEETKVEREVCRPSSTHACSTHARMPLTWLDPNLDKALLRRYLSYEPIRRALESRAGKTFKLESRAGKTGVMDPPCQPVSTLSS